MNNKKYELGAKNMKKNSYIDEIIKEVHNDLKKIFDGSNGVVDVEKNFLEGTGKFYSFFYRENFFSEYQIPILYVVENEGVVELHTYNLPVESQMEFLSVVRELEEYFILVRLEELEK